MALLEVQDLYVTFSTRDGPVAAVENLNFVLEPGRSLGVVGESGSGKSQTALAILGLLAKNGKAEGHVSLDQESLLSLDSKALNRIRGSRVGIIFQDPMTSLNPYLTIATQMVEVLVQHKAMDRGPALQVCLDVLGRVQIDQPAVRINQYPHQLSGGMRQRVAIAMALLCEPEVLIADEPTTALDVTVQAEILKLLKEIKETSNTALILISHDLAVVAGLCDHVLVMHDGQVMEQGNAEQLFFRPKHSYTQSLLAAVPTLDMPSGQRLKTVDARPANLEQVKKAPKSQGVVLKVADLAVHFPVAQGLLKRKGSVIRAVDGVSFDVVAGETLGIVGESGSGKSTLARGIVGLVSLTRGHVELDGEPLTALGSPQREIRCREIQMVFQDPYSALSPRMTVGQILAEPLQTHFRDLDKQAIDTRVYEAMEQVGLAPEEVNRYPHEYSGGQCQRVGIARALITAPKVIICDEPVSALDVSIQAQVVNLLRDLQAAFGLTLIFIAHDISVVKNLSQRILVMHRGKIVEVGESEQVCSKPSHPYTQKLLAAVPELKPPVSPP